VEKVAATKFEEHSTRKSMARASEDLTPRGLGVASSRIVH